MDNVIANYFSIMLLSGKPRIQSFLSLNCESTIYIDGTCLKLKVVLTNGFKLTFYQWRAADNIDQIDHRDQQPSTVISIDFVSRLTKIDPVIQVFITSCRYIPFIYSKGGVMATKKGQILVSR